MNNDVNNNQPEKDLKNDKKSFQGIGKWLLSLLLAAWMFVLGVIVGRETVPVTTDKTEQLQEELVRLKNDEQEQEVEQYQMEMDRLNEEQPELDFHVILKEMEQDELLLNQQGMGDTARRADRNTPEKNGRIPEKTALITKRSSQKTETRPARSENRSKKTGTATPSATAKPRFDEHTPAVAARVVYSKNGKIAIQVASFGDKDDARRVVSSLKKKGYPAFIAIAKIVDKGIWYRVRVGSFNTRKDASAVVSRLKKQGFSPMIVNNK